MRSNMFFPQLRFAFVLALGQVADGQLIDEIVNECRLDPSRIDIQPVIDAADRMHGRYGVLSVMPTKPQRVVEELNKSVEVFARTIVKCRDTVAHGVDVPQLVRHQSARFWKLSTTGHFSRAHLRFVSDPQQHLTVPIRRVGPNQHPSIRELAAHLEASCESVMDKVFLASILGEILHPLTIMRPGTIGSS